MAAAVSAADTYSNCPQSDPIRSDRKDDEQLSWTLTVGMESAFPLLLLLLRLLSMCSLPVNVSLSATRRMPQQLKEGQTEPFFALLHGSRHQWKCAIIFRKCSRPRISTQHRNRSSCDLATKWVCERMQQQQYSGIISFRGGYPWQYLDWQLFSI